MNQFDNNIEEIYLTALKMEEKGKTFYEKAITLCENKTGKEIFSILMNEELVHVKRIQTIYYSLKNNKKWTSDWKKENMNTRNLNDFFVDIVKTHKMEKIGSADDLISIDIGIDFENKSIEFYKQREKEATDPDEKEFIRKMIIEETKHFDSLEDIKTYLKDPEDWFMKKEKGLLDGA